MHNQRILIIIYLLIISCSSSNENQETEAPVIQTGTLQDIEGNVYKTVKIGAQWWMAENLKTTKYNDGQEILHEIINLNWFNNKSGAYAWYGNDSITYANTYGALYNWYAVDTKKLCPTGWHIPTQDDWITLIQSAGDFAGMRLRESGHANWQKSDILDNNSPESDKTRFAARPGGVRHSLGDFSLLGREGGWWSARLIEEGRAEKIRLRYNFVDMEFSTNYTNLGNSCRCVKD
ncbi:fibrobacter succinogenes major paralogous domain-containing protein [Flagellimonas sp. 2504JD4-2]